jgi:Trk-type K+ transport system membrane component
MLNNRLPPRVVTSAAILVGNTLYPLFLRLRIRIVPKIIPNNFEMYDSPAFLLHYAQRCYLLLFSKENSWYVVVGPIGH